MCTLSSSKQSLRRPTLSYENTLWYFFPIVCITPLFTSFYIYLSILIYFYHFTKFFNVRNYFVPPDMFSKLSKRSAYEGALSFHSVSWLLDGQTQGLQLQSSCWLVVNKIRSSIKSGTQPQLSLCSHRGTGQCTEQSTGKNVANTKPVADCLSQQYCLCFPVTINWQFYVHLCRVLYILKSNRCAYIKYTQILKILYTWMTVWTFVSCSKEVKQATSNCLLARGNMYL